MAASPHVFDAASDKNCKPFCPLELGSGEKFKQNLVNQQALNASKTQSPPQIFSDPNDQALYSEMLNDVMYKIIDNPDEHKVFRTALEGMNRNYPEILAGQEKNMFYSPAAFNFDSRIGTNETSVPEELERTKASLEAKQTLTAKEKTDLKVIQDHLTKLRPQLAEQEFIDALACFFYKRRGIFIHSLKLDQHLKVLTDKAKLHRRNNKNIGFGFTDLEKNLAEQFGISDQSLIDIANEVLDELKNTNKLHASNPINGRIIRKAIDDRLTRNEKTYVKKQFKPGQDYTIDEIKDGVKLGKFESDCRFAGETDLLIMLPDLKLFLCVEIKRHMKSKNANAPQNSNPKIDKNLTSAASQLKKNANFISLMHGAILSPGWRFAKVAAISPDVYNRDKICDHCSRFILTSEILKTPGGLEKWWKETGLADGAENIDQMTKDQSYKEFQLFFHRLISLSSVRVVPDPFHTWSQIQGNNPHHMAAGHTATTSSQAIDVGDALKRAHDAFKVLFFNRDQQALLTSDSFPHLLFFCDFGAGKFIYL